ncbi:GAF domain-containing protein [Candidatus Fermentibacterales bacterium]|nr:GAF domain-containing protein [Candidatus Fermentibacterales bacterium]
MSRLERLEARARELSAVGSVASAIESRKRLQLLCDEMRSCIDGYDWVGFYLVDPSASGELVLGPYSGEPTEHVRIRFGCGICGQAAQRLEVFLVDDVASEANYLSCSPEVRSEIVLPVIHEGALAGELDIDSHALANFGPEDLSVLERVAGLVSGLVCSCSSGLTKEGAGRQSGTE